MILFTSLSITIMTAHLACYDIVDGAKATMRDSISAVDLNHSTVTGPLVFDRLLRHVLSPRIQ